MRRRRAAFSAVLLLFVLGIIEGISGLATSIIARRGWMAYIPRFSDEQIAHYLASRNAALGWGPAVDRSGLVVLPSPRSDPASARSSEPCVSVYGDSFTYGDEARD